MESDLKKIQLMMASGRMEQFEVAELPSPYEILELESGESATFGVRGYEVGMATISPRYTGAPEEKTIPVVRVLVPREDKEYAPYYYDITSKRLVGSIIPILQEGVPEGKKIKITAHGTRPRKHFSVEIVSPA